MVEAFLAALVALSLPQDTATFRDAAAAEMYARARVRHIRQDSLVRDYQATVRTRLDATAGRGRFARLTTLLAHETVAEVTWRAPNDLMVKVIGARARAPIIGMLQGLGEDFGMDEAAEFDEETARELEAELRQDLVIDRPWFIPRALGDSIRLVGVPDHAALHPLADGATDHYRFALTDSVSLILPGRTVRAVKMEVRPKSFGPALVYGDMWLDSETADVVRLTVVFIGQYLWERPDHDATAEDSAQARESSKEADRYLSVEADVEYALIDGLYWMPHRQLLAITAELPWILNLAIPARAITTFRDYRVNRSPAIEFRVDVSDSIPPGGVRRLSVRRRRRSDPSDTTEFEHRELQEQGYISAGVWSDGRWEVDVPAADSLALHQWETEFRVDLDPLEERQIRESFARMSELEYELPPEWTGKRKLALAWERFADIVRFNRVQGLSVGLGVRFRPGPKFTTLFAEARFGIADLRPTALLSWRRDAPSGLLDISAYRTVREAEPWSQGLTIGNSLNAFFAGHDDADYFLASGGGVSYTVNYGALRDLEIGAYAEYHESMQTETSVSLPNLFGDFSFQENPPAAEGWFARGMLTHRTRIGPTTLRDGADLLAGDSLVAGRFWGALYVPFRVVDRAVRVTLRAGVTAGDAMEQFLFRVGGQQTVRGHTYGTKRDTKFYAAQLDVSINKSSSLWTPVLYADVGDTFAGDPLVGVGAGVAFLGEMLRFNLSWGLNPDVGARFDIVLRAPR
jgi:hypothetical protein